MNVNTEMSEEAKILQIFDYFFEEFERFKNKDKSGLIYRFFAEKGIRAKYAITDRGYKTIGTIDKGQKTVTGLAFVIFNDNDFFYGHLIKSKRAGFGYHRFPNHLVYRGDYENDEKISGVVFDPQDGEVVYRGGWKHDMYNGYGILRNPLSCAFYEGQFKNGLFNGLGKQTWPEGDKYEGSFLNGRPHGRGVLTLPNKAEYAGYFNHGSFHGRGSMKWASGDVFNGNFENGAIDGEGDLAYISQGVKASGVWDKQGSNRVIYTLNEPMAN